MMTILSDIFSYAEASSNLNEVMEKVWEDNAPVIITREGGRHVVVINKDDYDGWCETEYLTSTPANTTALNEAISEVALGKTVSMKFNAAGRLVRAD